jgi:hypothetical protein
MWNRKIKIDRIHSRAITDEIGERLRMAHSLVSPELPPRIQRQLDQLRELDREESPSIVPSTSERTLSRPLQSLKRPNLNFSCY